jgi:hypothetical protein
MLLTLPTPVVILSPLPVLFLSMVFLIDIFDIRLNVFIFIVCLSHEDKNFLRAETLQNLLWRLQCQEHRG